MTDLKHSKPYYYERGHVWFKATTVGELMEFLAQYRPDLPVVTTWEGTLHSLAHPQMVEVQGEPALQFDVEWDAND